MIRSLLPDRWPNLADLLLILGGVLRGAWFLLPGNTFITSPIYAGLATLPPSEEQWGLIFITVGILALLAVRRGERRARMWVALFLMAFWVFIGVVFFVTSPTGAGWQQFVYLMIPAWWNLAHINDRRFESNGK